MADYEHGSMFQSKCTKDTAVALWAELDQCVAVRNKILSKQLAHCNGVLEILELNGTSIIEGMLLTLKPEMRRNIYQDARTIWELYWYEKCNMRNISIFCVLYELSKPRSAALADVLANL